MAWNEPGGNDKDPWGNKNQGPPDLDEAFKQFNKWLNSLFGGGGSADKDGKGGSGFTGLIIVVLGAIMVWSIMGFFKVDERERAIVFRFGQYSEQLGPGLNWRPALIFTREIVSSTNIREYTSGGLMLTEDQNIVEMPLTVQWNISDVKAFVLNVRDPELSLRHATDSALRHVIGSSTLDKVLSDGRQKIAIDVELRLQSYLDRYGSGIQIVNINLQRAEPPKEVKSAFDDVIGAKEDLEKFKNEAQEYANDVIPKARGKAQRMLEEAKAYEAQVVAGATGDADRFVKLYTEYKKAPGVTRQRLYIDTLERVMANSSKILVDVEGGNNMFYMPLDKLTEQTQSAGAPRLTNSQVDAITREVANRLNRNSSVSTTRSGGR